MAKSIKEYNITVECDHEQYWPGHGIAFTDYDECVTGCGSTVREAFDDALNQLGESDYETSSQQNLNT